MVLMSSFRHAGMGMTMCKYVGNVSYFSSMITTSPGIQEDTPLSRASESHDCVVVDSDLYSAHHVHPGDDGLKGSDDCVVLDSDTLHIMFTRAMMG